MAAKTIVWGLLILFFGSQLAIAAGPEMQMTTLSPEQQTEQSNARAVPDMDFISKSFQGGLAEIQISQLAAEKSTSDDVKQFALNMVDDHTILNDRMRWAAQHTGARLPSISRGDKALIARLQKLSSTDFDNAYIVAMVKGLRNDMIELITEARQTQNPNLQKIVGERKPFIEQHLQMINQIAQDHHLMDAKGKLISADK
jgi:putative membrane protein